MAPRVRRPVCRPAVDDNVSESGVIDSKQRHLASVGSFGDRSAPRKRDFLGVRRLPAERSDVPAASVARANGLGYRVPALRLVYVVQSNAASALPEYHVAGDGVSRAGEHSQRRRRERV